jgi:hypothetical protein
MKKRTISSHMLTAEPKIFNIVYVWCERLKKLPGKKA